jgi:BASS family bile acid:Na+ symporter
MHDLKHLLPDHLPAGLKEELKKAKESRLLRFVKDWTLPIAMAVGVGSFFLFAYFPPFAPLKHPLEHTAEILTPVLIFAMLLLTFCKVDVRDLTPRRWHLWLLLLQLVASSLLAGWAYVSHETYKEVLEGITVCLICPTATAAAVITQKLGGKASSVATYTLGSNLLAALFVPLVFPLLEPSDNHTFLQTAGIILGKVFPTLVGPFLVAQLLRYVWPRLHARLMSIHELAFYLWGVSLTIVCAQTTRSIVHSTKSPGVELLIALGALLACVLQFVIGKQVGERSGERISAGQSLGQKNTVLAIWMAYTFLDPVSAIAPGSYVLWQNSINSWQLWKKRKKDAASKA